MADHWCSIDSTATVTNRTGCVATSLSIEIPLITEKDTVPRIKIEKDDNEHNDEEIKNEPSNNSGQLPQCNKQITELKELSCPSCGEIVRCKFCFRLESENGDSMTIKNGTSKQGAHLSDYGEENTPAVEESRGGTSYNIKSSKYLSEEESNHINGYHAEYNSCRSSTILDFKFLTKMKEVIKENSRVLQYSESPVRRVNFSETDRKSFFTFQSQDQTVLVNTPNIDESSASPGVKQNKNWKKSKHRKLSKNPNPKSYQSDPHTNPSTIPYDTDYNSNTRYPGCDKMSISKTFSNPKTSVSSLSFDQSYMTAGSDTPDSTSIETFPITFPSMSRTTSCTCIPTSLPISSPAAKEDTADDVNKVSGKRLSESFFKYTITMNLKYVL